jgi:hypothetical protein
MSKPESPETLAVVPLPSAEARMRGRNFIL